jgi:ParB family chromosome partitioning protein
MSKRALGRGLGALISKPKPSASIAAETSGETGTSGGVLKLAVNLIDPSPWQPRTVFNEEHLHDLADSIKAQGLIQPVVVREHGSRYHLVAGERRWRAVQILEWTEIPAVVMETSDAKMRELALVENLQREDLNPMENAYAYQALAEESALTHEQIAVRLGVSRARITNTLRLLDLPEEVKQLVGGGEISAGHGRAILSLPDAFSQIRLAQKVVKEGLSVREVESLVSVKPSRAKARETAFPRTGDVHSASIEQRLRDHLGTKVLVNDKRGKGTITIEYYSASDVARIMEKLGLTEDLS